MPKTRCGIEFWIPAFAGITVLTHTYLARTQSCHREERSPLMVILLNHVAISFPQ